MQTEREGTKVLRQLIARHDFSELGLRLDRPHETAEQHITALQQLAVAREHDPALAKRDLHDLRIAVVVLEQRVDAEHPQEPRKPSEMRVGDEAGSPFRKKFGDLV